MKINIQVKSMSKQACIETITYDYENKAYTVHSFLEATVEKIIDEKMNHPGIKEALSLESIEAKATRGKVHFGFMHPSKKMDAAKAKQVALEAFNDGLVALFVDEVRYEMIDEILPLKEGSVVAMIKMVFLAGRMW